MRHPAFLKAVLLGLVGISLCAHVLATELNTANEAELDSVKGLGPSTTTRILAERDKSAFKDWADFMRRIKGIKPSKASTLSANGLTVNGEGYTSPAKP